MNELTITLPVHAWNVVFAALAQRPFAEVSEIIAEIRKQADAATVKDTDQE